MKRCVKFVCLVSAALALQASAGAAPDLDCDGDVDRDDFLAFAACAAGPTVPAGGSPECGDADLDGDSDADLSDFAALQACFRGAGVPIGFSCACESAYVSNGTLHVYGTNAGNAIALRLQAGNPGILEIDFGDDGAPDYAYSRFSFIAIQVHALGGADMVRIDEQNGPFTDVEQTSIDGGEGDDVLLGGIGAELLIGGNGHDLIDGGPGEDLALLGGGDDEFEWNPGDGNDVIEGEGGADTLVFSGSAAAEIIQLTGNGDRLRVLRDVGTVILDADGIEGVAVLPIGGADSVVVNDLAATVVATVVADLADQSGLGDAAADVVTINGTAADDDFDVAGVNAAPQVSRTGVDIRVERGELANDRVSIVGNGAGDRADINGSPTSDLLNVVPGLSAGVLRVVSSTFAIPVDVTGVGVLALNGLGGADNISGAGNVAGVGIPVTFDGGEGDDTLLGSNGADVLIGGNGKDLIDGNQGNDTALMGAGDDVFQWDPGDGSDVVEGQGDSDTLLFNGSSTNEVCDASSNGSRLRFTRNIGNIVMDVAGVEQVTLNLLGGTDILTVNDLVPTDVATFVANLALFGGGGDAAADLVAINGTAANDTFSVSGVNSALQVSRPGIAVRVEQGELANDSVQIAGAAGDHVQVNGSSLADTISVFPGTTAGSLRVTSSTFAIALDAAGVSGLTLNGLGGQDVLSGAGNVAGAAIPVTFDGGADGDTLLGSNGADILIGGEGSDLVDGNQGSDTAFLGSGDDVFQWDPGDGSDIVEGQLGTDTLRFNASNASEILDLAANGGRLRLARNVGSVVLDVSEVEEVRCSLLGGADSAVVNDLTGTDVIHVFFDLASPAGSGTGDAQADTITITGTNADDTLIVAGASGSADAIGFAAQVTVSGAEAANDRLVVNLLAGDDTLEASGLATNSIQLTGNGGADDDILIGGDGNDTLLGGEGDDVLVGGPGIDVLDGGPGSNVIIQN